MVGKKIIRNLPSWIRDGANLNDLVDVINVEFDNINGTIIELKKQIQLSSATGGYLSDIAQIFGLSRKINETDNQFRARVKAFWPGFSGSGTKDDLKNVINRITGIDVDDISLTEIAPMKFRVSFNIGANFDLVDTVKELVFQNKAAGIYPYFEINTGFKEDTYVSDTISISIIIGLIYDNFNYDSNATYN